VNTESPPDAAWWQALGNPELDGLIQQAVNQSPSLDVARSRARAARYLVGAAEARLRPQLRAGGLVAQMELSEQLPILDSFIAQGLVDTRQELFPASFDAAWEVDVFGSNRHRVAAAEARAELADAALEDAHRTLVAEVARNYFELKNRQRQLELMKRRRDVMQDLAEWQRARFRTGVGSEGAVAEATAEALQPQARLPALQAGVLAARARLAVLCGLQPGDLPRLNTPLSLEEVESDPVPVGLPGDLLRRRPDIRQAEHALLAAEAMTDARAADLYPSFLLTGTAGRQAQRFSELEESESGSWLIAPSIQWTFYQGGGLRAGLDAARAEQEAARAAYQQAVLRAVAETETRLNGYLAAHQTRQELEAALTQVERALRIAEDAFETGVATEGDVLKAELATVSTESGLVQAQIDVLTSLVALHKALGGGWQLPERDGNRAEL
jgi:multidrug efflux system outer membrane protein